jgi:hypothetical protein
MRFLRDDGPSRFLRQVRVHLPIVLYECNAWPPDRRTWVGAYVYNRPYHETVLHALARNARQLEILELHTLYKGVLRASDEHYVDGLSASRADNSWVDPPLPYLPPCYVPLKECPPPLAEEHLRPVLDLLAPGDVALQLRIRQKLEQAYAHPTCNEVTNFWTFLWGQLWSFDPQKIFWGGTIMEILKSFSPSLRIIRLRGRVDVKWMTVVANLTGATVEASTAAVRFLADEIADSEWVVVQPARAEGVSDQRYATAGNG